MSTPRAPKQLTFAKHRASKLVDVTAVVIASRRLGRITSEEEADTLFSAHMKMPDEAVERLRRQLELEVNENEKREQREALLAGRTGR